MWKLFFIVVVILYICFEIFKYVNYIPVVAYDNNTYYLSQCKNCDDKLVESANTLAKINENILILIKYLGENQPQHPVTKFLIKNYQSKILQETIPESGLISYTENKSTINMCLRSRDADNKIYNVNILTYVVLHELAHFCNYNWIGFPIIGHGNEFRKIFKFLVENAIKCKIYIFDDYRVAPKDYCGLTLRTNIIPENYPL